MNIMNDLSPKHKLKAPSSLKNNVIERIEREEKSKKRRLLKTIYTTAAVLGLVVIISLPFVITEKAEARPLQLLTSAIKKLGEQANYIVKFKVRTAPNQNFAAIDVHEEFVETNFYKSFVEPYIWRIDRKGGRNAVYDGDSIYLWSNGENRGFRLGKDSQVGVLEQSAQLLDPDRKSVV